MLGKRFGRLTVKSSYPELSLYNSGRTRSKYYCECDCSKRLTVNINDLKSGHTRSCGCLRSEMRQLTNGEAGFRGIYRQYKWSAKSRNLKFGLNEEQFRKLLNGNCFYCNIIPKQTCQGYIYNGIDRLDNTKGYLVDNCVSACSMCNIAKKDFNLEEFLYWVQRVYEHQRKQNKIETLSA